MNTSEITGSSLAGGINSSSNTDTNSSVSKDEFLKMLTYQLRSQDPLNPMDNQQFAAQLAQFSQLEQLSDIRSLMESQVQSNLILSQSMSNLALPGLLGKSAKAMSNKIHFDGEKETTMGYTLPYDASSAEILIKDSSGAVVNKFDLDDYDLDRGDHQVSWNGQDENGNYLAPGDYTFDVVAKNSSGVTFNADLFTSGKIETVRFNDTGTVLVINGSEIALENVLDISTN